MKALQFDKKIHMSHFLRTLRRGVAATLAIGMILPTVAMGANPIMVTPPQVERRADGTSPEDPMIQIEANFVRNEYGQMDGTCEIALRVQTPKIVLQDENGEETTIYHPFRSLAVVLAYDAETLLPIRAGSAENDTSSYYSTKVKTLSDPRVQTAEARIGVGPGASTEGVNAGKQGLLEFRVSTHKEEIFSDMTTLAVAYFKVNPAVMGNISSVKRANGFELHYAAGTGDTLVTTIAELHTAMGESTYPYPAVTFAAQADIEKTECNTPLALYYTDKVTRLDYIPDFDPATSATEDVDYVAPDGTEIQIARPATPNTPSKPVDNTREVLVVARKDTDAGVDYSILSNLICKDNIEFTAVVKEAFMSQMVDPDKMVKILYYDYTNKYLGVQVLLPGDAREEVNAYVEENFIHPDLRYSTHEEENLLSSLERQYTYRGEYPYDGPVAIPDVASENYEAELAAYKEQIKATVADDGAAYPLTNKLDYVFYKRDTSYDEADRVLLDPDNDPNSGDEKYSVTKYSAKVLDSSTDAKAAELPYIYGWAVVDDLDDIANVWTTLGTAELTTYTGMDASGVAMDTTIDTSTTGACLQFADFSNLQEGQTLYVKAVYEPGTQLQYNGLYAAITPPQYERYGDVSTEAGGVYAISFSYARINSAGRGVSRMRDPSARIDYTPDVEGEAQKPFSMGMDVENFDTIAVTYTPSSALMSMEYSLRDKMLYDDSRYANPVMVEYNYYTGAERATHGNLYNVLNNFNYEEHPYSQHRGSMGFVAKATFNQIEKLCREAVETGSLVDLQAYINIPTINDLNWKSDMNATEYRDRDLTTVINKLVDAYRVAGDADLDWHQVQYHLINSTYSNGTVSGGLKNVGGIVSPAAGDLAYNWCRLDNCSGGSAPINSWTELMAAAADCVYTPNPNALNQLQDVFDLRQDNTAQPFADKDAMKAKLVAVVTALQAQGVAKAQVETLSWKQVQYLMDQGVTSGNIPADSTIDSTCDYWWENGGTKTISTWEELLEIRYNINNNGYFAGTDNNSGWWSGYTLNMPLTGKVQGEDKSVVLRNDEEGATFGSMADINAALDRALSVLGTAYSDGNYTGVSLMEIQYAMIPGHGYRNETDLMGDTDVVNKYWWITGTPTPVDMESLVKLVKQAIDGNMDDLLDNVTVKLVSGGPFWLRADLDGTVFGGDAVLRTELKNAVKTWYANYPDPDSADWTDRQVWSQLQNLLLGEGYSGNPDPGPTYQFWWYDDGHKPINSFAKLMEAAWNTWGGPNGTAPSGSSDPNAMDALTDIEFVNGIPQTDPETVDTTKYAYLRKDDEGTNFDAQEMDLFKERLKQVVQNLSMDDSSKGYIVNQNWIVIQYMLLGNDYRPANSLREDSSINYWWENGGSKPTITVDYTWADNTISDLTGVISDIIVNSDDLVVSFDAVYQEMTDTMVRALNLCNSSGVRLNRSELANLLKDTLEEYYVDYYENGVATDWDTMQDGNDALHLNWASLQQFILDGKKVNIKPAGLSPVCTWTPASSLEEGIDNTAADEWVDAVISAVSDIIVNSDDLVVDLSDVEALITDEAMIDLDFRSDAGTPITDKSRLANEIKQALEEYYVDYYDNGVTTDWDTMLDGNDTLHLDWNSFQYWLTKRQKEDLRGKSYEEMSTTYQITWFPPNDPVLPSTYALYTPQKLQVLQPVETSEATNTVTSEDGTRVVHTITKTTIDPNTGITEIREERVTELTVGDKLVTTTDIETTVINTKTGEVTRNTEYGMPVITDTAAVVDPEIPEDVTEEGKLPADEETVPDLPTDGPDETENVSGGGDLSSDNTAETDPSVDPEETPDKEEDTTGGGDASLDNTVEKGEETPDQTEDVPGTDDNTANTTTEDDGSAEPVETPAPEGDTTGEEPTGSGNGGAIADLPEGENLTAKAITRYDMTEQQTIQNVFRREVFRMRQLLYENMTPMGNYAGHCFTGGLPPRINPSPHLQTVETPLYSILTTGRTWK